MLRPVLNSYILSILYIEATHASNENVCVFVVLLITIEPEDALQVICATGGRVDIFGRYHITRHQRKSVFDFTLCRPARVPAERNGLQSISGSVIVGLYLKKYNPKYTFLLHILKNPCILLLAVA